MAMLETIITFTASTGSLMRWRRLAPAMAENANPAMLEIVAAKKIDNITREQTPPWCSMPDGGHTMGNAVAMLARRTSHLKCGNAKPLLITSVPSRL